MALFSRDDELSENSLNFLTKGREKPSNPILKTIWFIFSLALAVVIVGWLIPLALDTSWRSIFASLKDVSILLALLMLALALAALLVDSIGFKAAFGQLKTMVFLRLNAIAGAITIALPLGSTVSMGYLLVRFKKYGLANPRIFTGLFIAAVADIFSLIAISIFSLVCLAVIELPPDSPSWLNLAFLGLAGLIALVAILGASLFLNDKIFNLLLTRLDKTVTAFEEGFEAKFAVDSYLESIKSLKSTILSRLKSEFVVLLGAPLAARFLQGIAFAIATQYLAGEAISFLTALAIFGLSRLVAIIPLTPGGLGVVDAALAGLLVFYGVSSEAAVLSALLFTASHVLFPAALGGMLMPFERMSRIQTT